MQTRTYPRTLQQAFGPHTDSKLYPIPDHAPVRLVDKVIYAVSALALVVVIAVTL
jgi:hypothetical protein